MMRNLPPAAVMTSEARPKALCEKMSEEVCYGQTNQRFWVWFTEVALFIGLALLAMFPVKLP